MFQPISISLTEKAGISRHLEPIDFGIPFAKGELTNIQNLQLIDADKNVINANFKISAYWPDNSIRWLLVTAQISLAGGTNCELSLRHQENAVNNGNPFMLEELEGAFHIKNENLSYQINQSKLALIDELTINAKTSPLVSSQIQLIDTNDTVMPVAALNTSIIDKQDLFIKVGQNGQFLHADGNPAARFNSEITLYRFSSLIEWQFTIHNPKAAEHQNGLWDLGDPGSFMFKQLSLELELQELKNVILEIESDKKYEYSDIQDLSLYQASSGGDNWDCNNHVLADGEVKLEFCGYRLTQNSKVLAEGKRTDPIIYLNGQDNNIAIYMQHFWQNFPSRFEFNNNQCSVQLFPACYAKGHELQGGERKTFRVYIDLNADEESLRFARAPLRPELSEKTYCTAELNLHLSDSESPDSELQSIINEGIKSDNNFFIKREAIDEYGWRHFGDLYADHETDYLTEPEVFISHYNNQYDAIRGFARQYMLSGDERWYELMDDLARHVTDIDIYHTIDDRDEYNNGLFWHTDHYRQAETATHRTFSSKQKIYERNSYPPGGGPGSEHCYTTGLLLHYFMTGYEPSKQAVFQLSNWMHCLMESSDSIFGYLLGIKNKQLPLFKKLIAGEEVPRFKYPLSRATGNYINNLIDCYWLSLDNSYLDQVYKIIRETAHPNENIALRNLQKVESKWSYLVFLQSVTRYLDVLRIISQTEHNGFIYARDLLLTYADWILEHEEFYLSKPDSLEHPNHTWTAQEIRKADILYAAAFYCPEKKQDYENRADYFQDYVENTLSAEATRSYTRILVLLMQSQGGKGYYHSISKQGFNKPVNSVMQKDEMEYYSKSSLLLELIQELASRILTFSANREWKWIKTRFKLLHRH